MKDLKLTKYEKKNYILVNKKSQTILTKVKELEKHKLNAKDKEIIKLVRTQLKRDWETPLITYLDKLLRKYKK